MIGVFLDVKLHSLSGSLELEFKFGRLGVPCNRSIAVALRHQGEGGDELQEGVVGGIGEGLLEFSNLFSLDRKADPSVLRVVKLDAYFALRHRDNSTSLGLHRNN